MRHINKCSVCGTYTMKDVCACPGAAFSVRPPKFSPEGKYAHLQRIAKETGRKEKGLL